MIQNNLNKQNIRVVTFNVRFGEKTAEIAKAVKKSSRLRHADIILLQEIESHDHEVVSRTEAIAKALRMRHIYVPARFIKTGGTHGLAVLSKYPIERVETLLLPHYRLWWNSRNRIALLAVLKIGEKRVTVVNVHLDTLLNVRERLAQIEPVLTRALEEPQQKIIIAGDFNTMPIRWARRLFPVFYSNQRRVIDAFFTLHGFAVQTERVGYTIRKGFIRSQLDAIYVRGLETGDFAVERTVRVSDHMPLWMDVAL